MLHQEHRVGAGRVGACGSQTLGDTAKPEGGELRQPPSERPEAVPNSPVDGGRHLDTTKPSAGMASFNDSRLSVLKQYQSLSKEVGTDQTLEMQICITNTSARLTSSIRSSGSSY